MGGSGGVITKTPVEEEKGKPVKKHGFCLSFTPWFGVALKNQVIASVMPFVRPLLQVLFCACFKENGP
ncbi:hypothetical protein GCM10011405_33850 [Rufibacter glacialis]|nr:hypothetical protein GCM10011405_33850 [Rufibacter glacialis]